MHHLKAGICSVLVAFQISLPLLGFAHNESANEAATMAQAFDATMKQNFKEAYGSDNWIQTLAQKTKDEGDRLFATEMKHVKVLKKDASVDQKTVAHQKGLSEAKLSLLERVEKSTERQTNDINRFFETEAIQEQAAEMLPEEIKNVTASKDYITLAILNDNTLNPSEKLKRAKISQLERRTERLKNEIRAVDNMKEYFYNKAERVLNREFTWLGITFFDDDNNFFEEVLDLCILIVVGTLFIAGGFLVLWLLSYGHHDHGYTHTHYHDGYHHGENHGFHNGHNHTHHHPDRNHHHDNH